jgi:hypothetical protein
MKRPNALRIARREMMAANAKQPSRMAFVPPEICPEHGDSKIREVWRSNRYLAQVFEEGNGVVRVSICRTMLNEVGEWEDRITWDEMMQVKREIGHGDSYAVEVYPADKEIVNVGNLRHLWILPEPIVGWTR